MNNDWRYEALSVTSVAMAVVRPDGGLVGANRAFERLASKGESTPEALAQRMVAPLMAARSPGETAPGAGESGSGADTPAGWGLALHDLADGSWLVELMPDSCHAYGTTHREPLTGLMPRKAFEDLLARRLAASGHEPFGVLFLDLDGFKAINDELGHLSGDECLRQVGDRLSAAIRSHDAVARYGGDEFVALIGGITRVEELEPVRRRLQVAIGRPIATPTAERRLGVSIGHALSAEGFADSSAMLHAADRRMYEDKRQRAAEGAPPA